jgi:tRNA(Arg) A34 adenosine deaminase TadA
VPLRAGPSYMGKRLSTLLDLAERTHVKRSGRLPHFSLVAIAVRADGALVVSRNQSTKEPQPSCHAEARVLRKAGVGATVYVFRFGKLGRLTMAKPCPRCEARLRAYRATVWYSDWTGALVRL